MTERPARASRPESREVLELKQLRLAQPELATAIDMQVALVEMQRRVQARVPLPRRDAKSGRFALCPYRLCVSGGLPPTFLQLKRKNANFAKSAVCIPYHHTYRQAIPGYSDQII